MLVFRNFNTEDANTQSEAKRDQDQGVGETIHRSHDWACIHLWACTGLRYTIKESFIFRIPLSTYATFFLANIPGQAFLILGGSVARRLATTILLEFSVSSAIGSRRRGRYGNGYTNSSIDRAAPKTQNEIGMDANTAFSASTRSVGPHNDNVSVWGFGFKRTSPFSPTQSIQCTSISRGLSGDTPLSLAAKEVCLIKEGHQC